MSADRPKADPPRGGFRFITLALALSPLLPIVPWREPDGAWTVVSYVQVVRLHLAHSADSHPGMFLFFVPPLLAAVSFVVPSRLHRPRRALAIVAAAVAFLELPLVHAGVPFAPWFGFDALIPAERFLRHAWMLVFLTVLWVFLEHRPELEERT